MPPRAHCLIAAPRTGQRSTARRLQRLPRSTLDDTIEAGDEEIATPARQLVKWNEYNGDVVTLRAGAGFLYDFAAYSQDQASKEQFALFPERKIRDARLIFKGGFKWDRPVTLELRHHVGRPDPKSFWFARPA